MLDFSEHPHRRFNILTGEWVLVSPHRAKRPWQGKKEEKATTTRPSYDPNCYLCPGNTRAGGEQNPAYEGTYVFTNDFAALTSDGPTEVVEDGLFRAAGEPGVCRVLCFSPDHSLTIPDMSVDAIEEVVRLWRTEYRTLGSRDFINHVQIFENKGAIMGCSNPHPHGQIWAQYSIPEEVGRKSEQQKKYWQECGRSLLSDYLKQELESGERIICTNDTFVALVPFWAVWPYEAMIIPRRHVTDIDQFTKEEQRGFADLLKDLTRRFDSVFDTSFPYSSGIHQRPTDGADHPWWHAHMAFYPPLLRSATVKKFMVGYELFANPQRDITAEMAAATLRRLG